MEQKTIITIVVVLAVLVVGYFILTGLQRPTPVPEITIPETEVMPASEEVAAEQEQIREIAVSGTEFSFNPGSITLTEGERVRVVFTNAGRASHDFTLEGLGIKTKVIGPGQTDSVEFVAPASGDYTFFCSVAGHRQAGMEGNMEVK